MLGGGVRLLDGLDASTITFEPDRVIGSPGVTHVRYRVRTSDAVRRMSEGESDER